MARLIDADALLEEHCDGCSLQQREMCKGDPVCGSAMWIVEAPTVDAVEVVRCKDCKYRKKRVCANPCAGMWVGVELKETDYCSYGERRTNEAD